MTWNYNIEAAARKSLLAMAESTNGRLSTADERNQLFRPSSSTAFHSTTTTCNSFFYLSAAASSSNDNDNNNEDDDDDDDRRGMVEAFTDLDSLSSLTDLSSIDPTLIKSSSSKIDVYDGIIDELSDEPAITDEEAESSSSASSTIINDADGIGAIQTPPPSQ